MDKATRRAAVAAYKERKIVAALFALRCDATGQLWVGSSRNMEASRNRHLFALRMGGHPNPAVAAALKAHGLSAFAFEPLETYEEQDEDAYLQQKRLKARADHWRETLGAAAL